MAFTDIEVPNEAYNLVTAFKQNDAYNSIQHQVVNHVPDIAQTERERHTESSNTGPIAPLGTNLFHDYDEPIIVSANSPYQNINREVVYAEIPVNV